MTSPTPNTRRVCLVLLIMGLALRLLVFFFLAPQNTDNHFQIIQAIANTHRVPHAGEFNQAYHPPLYHLLAAPLARFGIKAVQGLSLIFSLVTLVVMYCLVRRLPWLDERFKPWCLALPALHPEFVIYTLLISNDTLAILLGALIFAAAARCLAHPRPQSEKPYDSGPLLAGLQPALPCPRLQPVGRATPEQKEAGFQPGFSTVLQPIFPLKPQLLLALWLGLGLSTKYTFLAFAPPVVLFIIILNARARLPRRVQLARIALFIFLIAALGGYKYIDNALQYGDPFISNIDFGPAWVATQRPTWRGLSTAFDVNILKLVRQPVIAPATAHSWPLMLYGSFWYSYYPECSFRSNVVPPLHRLGGLIDLLALAPTLLMVAGAASVFLNIRSRLTRATMVAPGSGDLLFALAIAILNLAMVIAAGWRYDVCSIFQSRILFPSYVALLFFFHEGLKLASRRRTLWLLARTMTVGLFILFLIYYAVEIPLSIKYPVNPMRNVFARTQLDMNAR